MTVFPQMAPYTLKHWAARERKGNGSLGFSVQTSAHCFLLVSGPQKLFLENGR